MKEWICREMSTSTSGDENGILMMETELIRCKDCKWAVKCYGDVVMVDKYGEEIHEPLGMNGYCSMAERKEE